jgi:hypothetical protein
VIRQLAEKQNIQLGYCASKARYPTEGTRESKKEKVDDGRIKISSGGDLEKNLVY